MCVHDRRTRRRRTSTATRRDLETDERTDGDGAVIASLPGILCVVY